MDLSHLSLWRNDPQAAADVLEHALAGDTDAQFAAGLIYAEGRGVPVDLVQSFFWLTQAVEKGDTEAERLRNVVGSQMSEEEYQQAQRLLKAAREAGQWAGASKEGRDRRH
jgi:uncharacterized protein